MVCIWIVNGQDRKVPYYGVSQNQRCALCVLGVLLIPDSSYQLIRIWLHVVKHCLTNNKCSMSIVLSPLARLDTQVALLTILCFFLFFFFFSHVCNKKVKYVLKSLLRPAFPRSKDESYHLTGPVILEVTV